MFKKLSFWVEIPELFPKLLFLFLQRKDNILWIFEDTLKWCSDLAVGLGLVFYCVDLREFKKCLNLIEFEVIFLNRISSLE
jgi:hypothetical protein